VRKVRTYLIHGTWGAAADWKNVNSPFRESLRETLNRLGRDPEFVPISWSALNSSTHRQGVAKALVEELKSAEDNSGDSEVLVVGHSHGGNIATDAARELLANDKGRNLLGVVCLNTPFLKHELRAWGNYLVAWLVLLLLGALATYPGMLPPDSTLEHTAAAISDYLPPGLGLQHLSAAQIALSLTLLFFVLIAKKLRIEPTPPETYDSARPRVLCLSCPDDEAITFLGLVEGFANLPQLLLHPLFLVLLALFTPSILWTTGHREFCGADIFCWISNLYLFVAILAAWVGTAISGGILGSLVVKFAFGLPLSAVVENMLSRVLVSYIPLRPAEAYFRGITEIKHKWLSPFQLLHSQIYRSPQTFKEIQKWLEHSVNRKTTQSAQPTNAA
jgi:pimeloyl-ACP methyl ester carboxylesterase